MLYEYFLTCVRNYLIHDFYFHNHEQSMLNLCTENGNLITTENGDNIGANIICLKKLKHPFNGQHVYTLISESQVLFKKIYNIIK
jgi:hypothetical protein